VRFSRHKESVKRLSVNPREGVNEMRYEIYKSNDQWRWRLKAGNHEILASGESYFNRSDCQHAINLVKTSAAAPVKEL